MNYACPLKYFSVLLLIWIQVGLDQYVIGQTKGDEYRLKYDVASLFEHPISRAKHDGTKDSRIRVTYIGPTHIQFQFEYVEPPSPSSSLSNIAIANHYYEVANTEWERMKAALISTGGLFVGTLGIPFKLRKWTRDGMDSRLTLSVETSVGPSVGWTFAFGDDTRLAPVVFVGLTTQKLANLKTPDADDMENVLALSVITGLVLDVWSRMHFGAFIGWDSVDDEHDDWEYHAQPWLSLGIGYRFVTF